MKQCGHQDGKVTVPHEDFLAKINAVRYAFLELGVENGLIVARTDSLELDLSKVQSLKLLVILLINITFLETEEIHNLEELAENDIAIHQTVFK